MKKLYELLGKDKPVAGDVGIEVEAEGKKMVEVDNKFWKTEDDGSLRGLYPEGRAEFVIKGVIPFGQVEEAVDLLIACQKKAEFAFSHRTSVHVHLNVQDLSHKELCNLLYTYFLLEEPLLTYCGEHRKANRFCLRLRDAEAMVAIVGNIFKDPYGLIQIPRDNFRYSSVNLEAFAKYGSVEFRAMRGTLDKGELLGWVNIIKAMKEFACSFKGGPQEIQSLFRKNGAVKFMREVFSKELTETLSYPGMDHSMNESFSLAYDIPMAYVKYVAPERVAGDWWLPIGAGLANPWEHANLSPGRREDYDYWIKNKNLANAMEIVDMVRRQNIGRVPKKRPLFEHHAAPVNFGGIVGNRGAVDPMVIDDIEEEEED